MKTKEILIPAIVGVAASIWTLACVRAAEQNKVIGVAMVLATVLMATAWFWKEFRK